MAYGLKWFSEFADEGARGVAPGEYIVEILERNYAGAPIQVLSGGTPFKASTTNVDNPFDAIRATKFTVEWITEEGENPFDIKELFLNDDKQYQIRLSKYNEEAEAEPIYYGYIAPTNVEEPFEAPPYPVTFTATCGLPFLRDDYFLDGFGSFVTGKVSLIKVIANCLTSTGYSLPIHTYVNLFEQAAGFNPDSPFKLAEIDADGLRGMKAMEVLEGILNAFNAFIVQSNGAWVIKSLKDQKVTNGYLRSFNANGDSTGMQVVDQHASIGRTPYASNIPNLRPMKGATESIAERNSIATNSVHPGIAVNRLPNGAFEGPLIGGNLPGWNINLNGGLDGGAVAAGWTRSGSNSPTDPYKMDITGALPTPYRPAFPQKQMRMQGFIELIPGNFPNKDADPFKYKVVFSGAFRASDISFFQLFVRLNEGREDRKVHAYMDNTGKWTNSKKNNKDNVYVKITPDVPVDFPTSNSFEDAQLQTFEITSQPITNMLKRDGMAVVRLYFDICAPQVMVGAQNAVEMDTIIPRTTWEDFAICITTETIYEGDHKYRVDSQLDVRNPNPTDYTTIIADKIGIETPEQRRAINRVMTGYMTRLDGSLTEGWKRFPGGATDPSDDVYEPIQKKSLRERIRLLCGKRRVLNGSFKGYGMRPDHTVFSRYDDPADPQTFYTINAWTWDVKKRQYELTLSELIFDAIPNEIIDVVGDENGRRGNRMYGGAGGSQQIGGSGTPVDPPLEIYVDDELIPTLYYTVGQQEIKVVDLAAALGPEYTAAELAAIPTHYTDWVSYVAVDRGEEEQDMQIQITAKPTKAGTDRVLIELISQSGADRLVIINLVALPATKVTYNLLDMTAGGAVDGALPGVYQLKDLWDLTAKIAGPHDWYQMTLIGGGDTGDAINETVNAAVLETEVGTYQFFGSGIETPAGQFRLFVTTALGEQIVSRQNITFTLYDEEYLNKLKFFLTAGGGDIGEIAADGSSKFIKPGALNIKALADDVNHDNAVITLYQNEVALASKTYPLGADSLTGNYLVYDTDTELAAGFYNVEIVLSLDGEEVLVRYADFTINEEEPEATENVLKIGSANAGKTNFTLMGTLAGSGNVFPLPASGWSVWNDSVSEPYDWEGFDFYQFKGGSLIPINTQSYGVSPVQTYPGEVTFSDHYLFGTKNSKQIDSIHADETAFRVIHTRRAGGAGGKLVASSTADFSFGVEIPIDDAPISEPGGGLADYIAGAGMSEITEDYIKRFDVNVDSVGIEIFEPESPNDPETAGLNHLRLKAKGVKYANIQDMPAKTVLGNPTTATGTPTAIPITKLGVEPDPGDIPTVDYIEDLLEDYINGTENFLSMFGTGGHTLVDSAVRQSGLKIGIGKTPNYSLDVLGISAAGQFVSGIEPGSPPMVVQSNTKVLNFHADYVGRNVIAGTGLTGGGILTADRTLAFDTVWGDARYAAKTFVPTLQSVLTAGNTAINQTMSIQGPAGSLNYISRFGYNDGWLEILSGTSFAESFLPTIRGTASVSTSYGLGIIGQGQDSYTQAAILLSGRNTSGTGTITGKVLSVRNYTTEVFSVDATGNSAATGVITAIVGNSTQWSEAYSWGNYALKSVVAGNGLTGGGGLATNPVLTLGTPSTITNATTNSVTSTSHTHAITTGDLVMGDNMSSSGTLTGRLVGAGNVVIACNTIPWVDITSKPTTLLGFGITDAYTKANIDSGLNGKENVFSKGDLIMGDNMSSSGTLTGRLVGAGNVVIACNTMPWNDITGKPTTIAGYGITDVYTKNQVDIEIAGRAQAEHTHTSDEILNFPEQVRLQLSAGTGITFNQTTGVISATGSAGPVGVGTQAQRRATSGLGKLWVQTDGGTYGAGLYYFYTVGGIDAWIRLSEDSVDYTFTGGGA
ncbi:hypothetical protein [Dyadobacter sp. CY351]|uniref:hypothetical protein n=1 Tax=Dyadobacter sp. CY351 TaxID=2909337 RepID=UPI001F184D33|nr:hypothetical protein [Dyadobacter sp. CY351]MCF2517123.1 hypothetical protein [Dyadobacter sp. CY351]